MENFFSENLLLNIGGTGLAALSLGLLWFVFKGYRAQGSEINKLMSNHLHDVHEDKIKDLESREKNTEALTKLVDKIDNLR